MKQHIKIIREFNSWRKGGEMTCDEDYPKRLGESLDEVVKAAERYELVRTLSPAEYKALWMRHVSGEGLVFDDLVDEMVKARKK
jgi:hypothetical protein